MKKAAYLASALARSDLGKQFHGVGWFPGFLEQKSERRSEDYPNYYDYLSIIFSKVKQKPRVVEEHDSFSAVMSAVEAGTGVAIATDFRYSFGNRLKFLHITPEPKPISAGIVALKGRLSPAAEKFWQCAKEVASANDRDCLTNRFRFQVILTPRRRSVSGHCDIIKMQLHQLSRRHGPDRRSHR